jgi:hypothetical protein
MVLAELPRYHDVEYMYFSTRHWAHLLSGYSGFLPFDAAFQEGMRTFPSAASIEQLHRSGATHLTYNCALESARDRCAGIIEQLDNNASLELVASERWEKADVRLYRFR